MELKKLSIILGIIIIMSSGFISADYNIFVPGNYNNQYIYNLSYVNATIFYGNGSQLTGVIGESNSTTWWASVSGWVSGYFKQTGNNLDFNETKLNETIDDKVVSANSSLKAYVDTQDVSYNTSMTNYVGDVNDSMTSYVNTQDTVFNDSMKTYTDNTVADYLPLAGGTMTGAINNLSQSFISNGEGLVLNLAFDEESGSIAYDSKGSNDGTINGSTLNTSGKFGNAYTFDGVNDYVNCGNDVSLDIVSQITVSTWINPANDVGTQYIIAKDIGVGVRSFYFNRIDDTLRFASFGLVDITINAYNLPMAGTWNHIVFTYNGSDKYIYVNGLEEAHESTTGNLTISERDVVIGAFSDGTNNFNGSIDEVKIYNRALTQAEIQADYLLGPHASGSPDGDKLRKTGGNITGNLSVLENIEVDGIVNATAFKLQDANKVYFGSADDVSIAMNSTTFNILDEVGSIVFNFQSFLKYVFDGAVEVEGSIKAEQFIVNASSGYSGTCVNVTYSGGIAVTCND